MKSKAINVVMFALGMAVGSLITWQCVKKKYEQIAQEEIDSVKKVFSYKEPDAKIEVDPVQAKVEKTEEKNDLTEYVARLEKEGYINYSGINTEEREQEPMEGKPYVISPEEFGEYEEYEKISLSYYADHVLADENDELVEDVENVVGSESLTHFGEYEDDSVFVRNDRLKCDYEILMDQRTHSDVIKMRPHQREE